MRSRWSGGASRRRSWPRSVSTRTTRPRPTTRPSRSSNGSRARRAWSRSARPGSTSTTTFRRPRRSAWPSRAPLRSPGPSACRWSCTCARRTSRRPSSCAPRAPRRWAASSIASPAGATTRGATSTWASTSPWQASSPSRTPTRCAPPSAPCPATACWSRPTHPTWPRCRIVAGATSRPTCAWSPRRSPQCAASPSPPWRRRPRRTPPPASVNSYSTPSRRITGSLARVRPKPGPATNLRPRASRP